MDLNDLQQVRLINLKNLIKIEKLIFKKKIGNFNFSKS
jgi:hypothetical protein